MKTSAANWITRALGMAYFVAMLGAIALIMLRAGPQALERTALFAVLLTVAAGAVWVWDRLGWSAQRTAKRLVITLIYGCTIGAILIFWHPPPIWDVPLAQLTLGAIAENAFKLLALLVVGFALLVVGFALLRLALRREGLR
ncbi:MAG: hypothetical protein WB689_12365 [Xanthobacteraceae bacterium]